MTTAGANDRKRMRLAPWVGLGLAVFLLAAQPLAARAQRDGTAVDRARAEIRELLERARDLREAGEDKEAKELTNRAEVMKAKLGRERGRRRRGRPEEGRPEEILDGLRRGIAALHALGHHDQAEKLEAVAREFQREHAGRSQRGRAGRRRGENKERQVARHQLEIMRMAMEGLAERERRDGADLLEHAIHARELALEGRRGEDAQHVRRTAPSREQQAELLERAAGELRELGRNEQAGAVAELARSMARKRQRRQGSRPTEHVEAVMHRMAQLEERLAGMERAIERLADQLHDVRANAEEEEEDDDN